MNRAAVCRALGAASSALLCLAPAGAGAAPRAPEGPALPSPGITRSIESLPHGPAFLDHVNELRRDGSCECDWAYPVGDVDGDGVEDVAHVTDVTRPTIATRLQVLAGRTGEPMFQTPLEVPGWAYVTHADLGPQGPGLLYVSYVYAGWPAPGSSVVIGAVSNRGVSLWQRRWDDASAWTGAGSVDTQFESFTLLEEGSGPTDVVVATSLRVGSYGTTPSIVSLERIAGPTGSTVDRGSYAVDRVDEVAVDALYDVSGPGTSGLVVQTSTFASKDVTMDFRHEVSAEPVWSISLRPPWGFLPLPDAADVTGDRDAEILVERARPLRTEALDAETGETTWSVKGYAEAVIPGPRKADLLLGDATMEREGTVDYELRRTGPRPGWSWEGTYSYTGDYHHWPSGWGWSRPVGDATGDGAADVRVDVELLDDDGDHTWIRGNRQFLVDGRTGDVVRAGTKFFPLDGSFTGATSDAVEFHRRDGRLEVSGLDGATGKTLWTTRLPVSSRSEPCTWYADVLRTKNGADLLFLTLPGGHGDVELALDGSSGELLWKS